MVCRVEGMSSAGHGHGRRHAHLWRGRSEDLARLEACVGRTVPSLLLLSPSQLLLPL